MQLPKNSSYQNNRSHLQIRTAKSSEYQVVSKLLENAKLLTVDLDPELQHFFVVTDNNKVVGTGGLEIFDHNALLRSLVVSPAARGQQLGKKLTDTLCQYAQKQQVQNLYLLTETAEVLFTARGFERTLRDAAPDTIKQTQQFSGLCHDSATLMVKRL